MPVGASSAELYSLYRLFLRATSAAVLHHPTATRNIRKLYRPIFIEAARVESRSRDTHDPASRKRLENWLVDWNERADNTLELLHTSAVSRGLSHQLTRNMGFLTDAYLKFYRPRPGRKWDPQLPPKSPLYSVAAERPSLEKGKKRLERDKLDNSVFRAVGQVIGLAEGRSEIWLGRLPRSK